MTFVDSRPRQQFGGSCVIGRLGSPELADWSCGIEEAANGGLVQIRVAPADVQHRDAIGHATRRQLCRQLMADVRHQRGDQARIGFGVGAYGPTDAKSLQAMFAQAMLAQGIESIGKQVDRGQCVVRDEWHHRVQLDFAEFLRVLLSLCVLRLGTAQISNEESSACSVG